MEKKPTSKKKVNKSLLYYGICGGAVFLIVITLLLIYAFIEKVDILAWFGTKYAFLMYGAILIYLTIGVILVIRDRIRRM